MKKAYDGFTFAGTLYCDMLRAAKYRHEGDTIWRVRGWFDMEKFNKEYGYPVPNTDTSGEDWKLYGEAFKCLEDRGLVRKEFYSRPAGKGWVSWYWRFELVLWGDKLAIADKYVAAMNKAKGAN